MISWVFYVIPALVKSLLGVFKSMRARVCICGCDMRLPVSVTGFVCVFLWVCVCMWPVFSSMT